MIILISGATHTGKTLLAQRLLAKHQYPYLSIDHLKMGLIRSGNMRLTPSSPVEELQAKLWPIVREIIKTAVENRQNLIVEGCYIPFDYRQDFAEDYLPHIKSIWLIFSKDYINQHFDDILRYESVVEHRTTSGDFTKTGLLETCQRDLDACMWHGLPYILINDYYEVGLSI